MIKGALRLLYRLCMLSKYRKKKYSLIQLHCLIEILFLKDAIK